MFCGRHRMYSVFGDTPLPVFILRAVFIPASNEPGSHACMDIWRLQRGI